MSSDTLNESSLRPNGDLLFRGVAISVAVHLLIYLLWVLALRYDWLHAGRLPAWLQPAKKLAQIQKLKNAVPLQPRQQEAPLLFIEVNPDLAAKEPPKDAKFYSSLNALAANPDPKLDTPTPKIDGTQKVVPKTEDVPRSAPKPAPAPQPPAPQPTPTKEIAADAKPKGGQKPGDLAKSKLGAKPGDGEVDDGSGQAPTPRPRPRTLTEAAYRQAMTGQKMIQDGGHQRRGQVSLNTKQTLFGAYDEALVRAVQQHWEELIYARLSSISTTGTVVVEFRLHPDGRITDERIVSKSVNDMMAYLCECAIHDPAPFEPWPDDLKRMAMSESGKNYRDVTFTFNYIY